MHHDCNLLRRLSAPEQHAVTSMKTLTKTLECMHVTINLLVEHKHKPYCCTTLLLESHSCA